MKKLLFILLVWLYPLFSFGAINEYLTDVYFANGILTDEGNATANTELLRNAILFDTYQGIFKKFKKEIGVVSRAYNHTYTELPDFGESFYQILNATYGELGDFTIDNTDAFIGIWWLRDMFNSLFESAHNADLKLQEKTGQATLKSITAILFQY
jgi:hypothetical protein